jgi:hypothetical protein
MTNCPVCQRETSPVKIGGQLYCSICGTPASSGEPKRLSLDLSPRNRGPKPPAAPAASHPQRSASAAELHQRVKPADVLDLRGVKTPPVRAYLNSDAHKIPAAPPKSTTHERHLAHLSSKMEMARKVELSPLVHKFDGRHPIKPNANTAPAPQQAQSFPAAQPHPAYTSEEPRELPSQAVTSHEALTKLAAHAPAPEPASANHLNSRPWRPHLGLSPNASRTTATVAAVAIMSGYIWMQNYPKLALQTASSKAGITASLPSYLPSSYILKSTDTGPGLVTLNFSSPSTGEPLKIQQHRTTWDSSSLLDNYVAKATDDYSTVQGQGLTIYLFNDNQAAWVNRGIWYSIAGAGRLSREQILKIAYSL